MNSIFVMLAFLFVPSEFGHTINYYRDLEANENIYMRPLSYECESDNYFIPLPYVADARNKSIENKRIKIVPGR